MINLFTFPNQDDVKSSWFLRLSPLRPGSKQNIMGTTARYRKAVNFSRRRLENENEPDEKRQKGEVVDSDDDADGGGAANHSRAKIDNQTFESTNWRIGT